MIDQLRLLVDTDSGSYNKEGVDRVRDHIRSFLVSAGLKCETIPHTRFGDALRATLGEPDENRRPILLMGHRDTVFPQGEAQRRPFHIEGGRAYGPGVADMKAGLVMNSFVLAAFAKFGALGPLVGLYTSDEEIASPSSRVLIEQEARRARAVFNAEPGRPSGNVVTGRKGGVFMRLAILGVPAHSGVNFEQGVSAIEELARKISALHALTDLERGITLNVGLVSGGTSVNTVAPHAHAEIDLRYLEPQDRAEVVAKIEKIAATSFVKGTKANLEILGEFVPLVPSAASRRLFELYAGCARRVGLTIEEEFTGGCADSGFAAMMGAATLCATGPCGGKAHSPDEYLELDTMVPRAQALALSILALGPP
ncbi:M20 family metallopeptidase [Microvirga makkahensis]|uniref:M20/M25/M40 family metallo-hydrolase n=1 Tax=Microvirga makkahensis TaxID=1128670 RepID=A0A7X3SPF8_9HYPH|nr:M20 family metallopeptidase [Microvirga makkahensis]MXQ12094.1 M20/M25/M40 family metallo-hydrolase [Microvirga makkahensis]